MNRSIINFGHTLFTSEGNERFFKEMLSRINLKPPVIIKPNWSSSRIYTEARILDWILSSIKDEVIVVESYAMWRNEIFLDPNQIRDNNFLELLRKQKKEDLRENDKWFLKFSEIQEVLDKHNVEYLNISEELWADRICNSKLVENEVENQFSSLSDEIPPIPVPTSIFDMKGGTILNLAKPKRTLKDNFVSLSLKNMFGMIPTPWRRKYHGANEELLTQSIIDINKIYHSLFDVVNIIEGVFTTSETTDNPMSPTIHENTGYIWASEKSLELDALVTTQLGLDPHRVDYLEQASKTFGPWSQHTKEYGQKYKVVFPREQ